MTARLQIADDAPDWAHDLRIQLDKALATTSVRLVQTADLPAPARSRGQMYGLITDGRLVYSDGSVWRFVGSGLPV